MSRTETFIKLFSDHVGCNTGPGKAESLLTQVPSLITNYNITGSRNTDFLSDVTHALSGWLQTLQEYVILM
jgi:hypothetical protein